MNASDDFVFSSPLSASGQRRKSKFTFKQLSQLGQYSTATPLRIVAHVDLDAFYAQCESIRLGLSEDQPLAVQQWGGLIAVNYPARAKGVTRFLDIGEAKKLCPDIMLQHVATWREGDEKWQYHPDAFDHIATHKVSLDPYRAQSRSILKCIRNHLPGIPLQKVEKASVDEVFLDLSAHVHSVLLGRYSEIRGPAPYDDPTENLPTPPTTALDWGTDSLIDLDRDQTEDDDPDWDDIAMCVASEIVRGVRQKVREELGFTCSAGIAKNKMLAKLGSAHKKPNNQTIVRNRAVQQFLGEFKFTKMRNLGGKLGEQVASIFGTEQVSELLNVPLDQMKSKLGSETGSWVYSMVRGDDSSEVNSRTQIKSMLSAKSFRPTISTEESALRWLRIFVADIFSRLVEDGVLENRRRPKTMNLHHRQGGQTWSRQIPIPQGKAISEEALFGLAKTLLRQIILEGHVWPCSNLSLSVGGFEEGPTGNHGIGGFLVKGDEARIVNSARTNDSDAEELQLDQAAKKRKVAHAGIADYFQRGSNDDSPGSGIEIDPGAKAPLHVASSGREASHDAEEESLFLPEEHDALAEAAVDEKAALFECPKCHQSISILEQIEHADWHFARELDASERDLQRGIRESQRSVPKGGVARAKPAKAASKGAEKGQMKLDFGGR